MRVNEKKKFNVAQALLLVLTLVNTASLFYIVLKVPNDIQSAVVQQYYALKLSLAKTYDKELEKTARKIVIYIDNKFKIDLPELLEQNKTKLPKQTGPALFVE
jgi:hypothetical protein